MEDLNPALWLWPASHQPYGKGHTCWSVSKQQTHSMLLFYLYIFKVYIYWNLISFNLFSQTSHGRSIITWLLVAGNSCNQRTLLSIPGSLGTLEQVWLFALAMDCRPVELGCAWTEQRNCSSVTWKSGRTSKGEHVSYSNLKSFFILQLTLTHPSLHPFS